MNLYKAQEINKPEAQDRLFIYQGPLSQLAKSDTVEPTWNHRLRLFLSTYIWTTRSVCGRLHVERLLSPLS